jgi:hypothetical protein
MHHPERSVRPSDCPEGAVYIRHTDQGGDFVLNPVAPFPIVVEGGAGNDNVTVVGQARNPVIIDGGKGDDSVVVRGGREGSASPAGAGGKGPNGAAVQDDGASLIGQFTPAGLTFVGCVLITFVTIAVIAWRALAGGSSHPGY